MTNNTLTRITIICFLTLVTISAKAQYEPSILFYNDSNQLVYVSDEEGNHIPDFSYVGYKNGEGHARSHSKLVLWIASGIVLQDGFARCIHL